MRLIPFCFVPVLFGAIALACPAPAAMAQEEAGGLPRLAAPAWQTVELGRSPYRYPFPVYANLDLAQGRLEQIRHVVVLIHGINRDANHYYETGAALLWLNPARANDTLVVAPKFAGIIDRGLDTLPAWRRSHWVEGEESVKAAHRPTPVSSFDVLDDLLLRLSSRQRLPHLQDIVVAGHSAGGQMVQRYAALNPIDERIRASGVALRYVVANPSSYLYFTRDRPKEGSTGFGPFNPGLCPDYNRYKFGLEHLPAHLQTMEPARIAARYASRDITYLLGNADNNPEHRLLDKTCGAEAEGATRLARGRAYVHYEAWLPAMKKAPAHHTYEVVGAGHDNRAIFGSTCGAQALLGHDAQGAPDAAACTPPQ